MFEHMKNYQVLLKKVSIWLRPKSDKKDSYTASAEGTDESLLFIHIFCHRTTPYHFVEDDGWMAKNFFSGKHVLLMEIISQPDVGSKEEPCHLMTYSYVLSSSKHKTVFSSWSILVILPVWLDTSEKLVFTWYSLFSYPGRLAATAGQEWEEYVFVGTWSIIIFWLDM